MQVSYHRAPTTSREGLSTSLVTKTEEEKSRIPEKQFFISSGRLSLKSTNESRKTPHSTSLFYGKTEQQKSSENLTFSPSPSLSTSKTEETERRKAEKKTFGLSGILRLKSPTTSREGLSTSSVTETEEEKSRIPEKQFFISSGRLSLKSANESRKTPHSTRLFYEKTEQQKSSDKLTFYPSSSLSSLSTSKTEKTEPPTAEKKTFVMSGRFRLKSPSDFPEKLSHRETNSQESAEILPVPSSVPPSTTSFREFNVAIVKDKTQHEQTIVADVNAGPSTSYYVYRVPTETSSSSTGLDLKITSSTVKK
ncbi:uncharacterized protein LOC122499463 [Leptopilina heterotoma]|uniref:uncharacterized protein LOC122499463 n=1 Tax=Leptopilina heterotoma TaxID=63436 RepID=UPI001CA7C4C4|nr:uncharacterized protein LOC122499463 [Leptopilina heterotoma]